MAADPEFVARWIEENGPYVFHGVAKHRQAPPEVLVAKISREGIVPQNRQAAWPDPDKFDWDGYDRATFSDVPWDFDDEVYDAWLSPRPGHVFLAVQGGTAYGDHIFRVDLRQLDPALINPDDDLLRDNDGVGDFPELVWGLEGIAAGRPLSLGEQAEQHGFGSNPDHTHKSFDYGVIAYRGSVPVDAIELLPLRAASTGFVVEEIDGNIRVRVNEPGSHWEPPQSLANGAARRADARIADGYITPDGQVVCYDDPAPSAALLAEINAAVELKRARLDAVAAVRESTSGKPVLSELPTTDSLAAEHGLRVSVQSDGSFALIRDRAEGGFEKLLFGTQDECEQALEYMLRPVLAELGVQPPLPQLIEHPDGAITIV